MIEVLQVESELQRVLDLYREEKPKHVLEIGVWEGGTLKEWLARAPLNSVVVAVDLLHKNRALYETWTAAGVTCHVVLGNSHDSDIILAIEQWAPYDWIFIDGDHSYKGVRQDVDVCLSMLSLDGSLLLHDIVPPLGRATYPPGDVLVELESEGYDVERIIDAQEQEHAHGIGIVRK